MLGLGPVFTQQSGCPIAAAASAYWRVAGAVRRDDKAPTRQLPAAKAQRGAVSVAGAVLNCLTWHESPPLSMLVHLMVLILKDAPKGKHHRGCPQLPKCIDI